MNDDYLDPAIRRDLQQFELLCTMLGPQATEEQCERLISTALEMFGTAMYSNVANIALYCGVTPVYTEFNMRAGECGL